MIQEEITNRPTPETYDLLAWNYYQKGDYKKSLMVAKEFVISKIFEPEVLYHLAEIYKKNGMQGKADELKSELLESAYEIGPVLLSKVETI